MTGLPNDPTELPIFGGTPRGVEPDGPTLNPITQMRRPAAHALAGPIEAHPATHRPRLVPVDTPAAPAPRAPSPPHHSGGIDWQQVAMLRSQASDQLTAALSSGGRGTDRLHCGAHGDAVGTGSPLSAPRAVASARETMRWDRSAAFRRFR